MPKRQLAEGTLWEFSDVNNHYWLSKAAKEGKSPAVRYVVETFIQYSGCFVSGTSESVEAGEAVSEMEDILLLAWTEAKLASANIHKLAIDEVCYFDQILTSRIID